MANDRIAVQALLAKTPRRQLTREMIGFAAQRLMEPDIESAPGPPMASVHPAARPSATAADRDRETRAGTAASRSPKLRKGGYFPGFLEPRRVRRKPSPPANNGVVADRLRANPPKLAALRDAAEADVLAFMDFPRDFPREFGS